MAEDLADLQEPDGLEASGASLNSPVECTLPPSLELLFPPERNEWFLNTLLGPPKAILRWSERDWKVLNQRLPADDNGPVSPFLLKAVHKTFYKGQGQATWLARGDELCMEQANNSYLLAERALRELPKKVVKPHFVDYAGLSAMVLAPASFRSLVEEVRGHCSFVGPAHMGTLLKGSFMDCVALVETPCCNLATPWELKEIVKKARAMLMKQHKPHLVFVAAGLAAKALVPDIFRALKGRFTVLDAGGVLDIFAGQPGRLEHCQLYPDWISNCHAGQLKRLRKPKPTTPSLMARTAKNAAYCKEQTERLSLSINFPVGGDMPFLLDLFGAAGAGDIAQAGVGNGKHFLRSLFYVACTGQLRDTHFHIFDSWDGTANSTLADPQNTLERFYLNVKKVLSFGANIVDAGPGGSLSLDQAWNRVLLHRGHLNVTMLHALQQKKLSLLLCTTKDFVHTYDCLHHGLPAVLRGGWLHSSAYFATSGVYEAVGDVLRGSGRALGPMQLSPEELGLPQVEEGDGSCKPPSENITDEEAGTCAGKKYAAASLKLLS